MLISQRKDKICFLGTTYKIFANEDYNTFFDPREHGFFIDDSICDAGKGYHCSYYVKYNRLILEKMYTKRGLVWWGRSKRSANPFIFYTGGLIISEEKHPQKMLDLKFNEETLEWAEDLTKELKGIKEAVSEMQKNQEGQPTRSKTSARSRLHREIAEKFFSTEYD